MMVAPESMRRVMVLFTMGLSALMYTYYYGQSATMIADLIVEKENFDLSDDTISWIIASGFPTMILGGIAATLFTERFGRRLTLVTFSVPVVAYWFIIYYAQTGAMFFLGRIIAGFTYGGLTPMIYISTTEYSAPEQRGSNFAFVSALGPVGNMTGQLLGLIFTWRTAALIAIPITIATVLFPLFFVESPQWLASKGKFKECEEAFRLLHGHKSERELELLIEVEKSKFDKNETKIQVGAIIFKKLKSAVTKSYFWRIMLLSYVIQFYKIIAGFVLKGMLGVTILQHFTGQLDVLKFSILVESLVLSGCLSANFIIGKSSTRSIIFSGGLLNNVIIIVLCILLYVKWKSDVLSWVICFFYGLHLCVSSATAMPLLEMIPQEMYPLEIKAICTTIMTCFCTVTLVMYTKIMPIIFVQIDYYGAYIMTVFLMSLSLWFLWIKLPETKDKTLQEIELFVKNEKSKSIDGLLKGDQIKGLV